jgi:hypothetical protein
LSTFANHYVVLKLVLSMQMVKVWSLFLDLWIVICVINCMTGSLGAQNVKVLNLHFGQKRVGLSQQFGTRSWISKKSQKYTSLVTSQQTVRPLNLSDGQSSEILCKFFILWWVLTTTLMWYYVCMIVYVCVCIHSYSF